MNGLAGFYLGSALAVMDAKGRFAIPVDMRDNVVQGSGNERILCLSKHEDKDCLVGFGRNHLSTIEEEILRDEQFARTQGQPFDREGARVARFSLIEQLSFDAAGRFFIPPFLKDISGIEGEAFFRGASNRFEIWNPDRLLEMDGPEYAVAKQKIQFQRSELAAKGKSRGGAG